MVHVGPGASERLPVLLEDRYEARWRHRTHAIVDARVLSLHRRLAEGLSAHRPLTVPSGERSKSLARAERLLRELARRRADRASVIVALGGGVTGDLAGFVASTFLRGVDLVQVPTTLLAQVDASIGGKTGINIPEGKNLVGTFHQPQFVVADTRLLQTLPRRHVRAGMAEVVKSALVAGGAFWESVVARGRGLCELAAGWTELIRSSIEVKARIVAADEREAGPRQHLNLGHTLGHALEAATLYRHYLHGEAIAVGLLYAAALSERCAGLPAATREAIEDVALPLARRAPGRGLRWSDLEPHLARDKKVRQGRRAWVLIEAPGTVRVDRDVTRRDLDAGLMRLRELGLL